MTGVGVDQMKTVHVDPTMAQTEGPRPSLLEALRCAPRVHERWCPLLFLCRTPRTIVALYFAHADIDVRHPQDRPFIAQLCENESTSQETAVSLLPTLFALGADIDVVMPSKIQRCGSRPLSLAVRRDRFRVAKWLIEAGADVNAPLTDDRRLTPMTLAAERDHSGQLTELLLQYGARVDDPDDRGQTSFSVAVRFRNVAAMKVLHRYGCDVNYADRTETTPLMVACSDAHSPDPGVVACLLEMKTKKGQFAVDVHGKDRDGRTPLGRVVGTDVSTEIVHLLLLRGAKADDGDRYGWTPFIRAARLGDVAVMHLLYQQGCNVNISDRQGMTPVMHACQRGNRAVIDCLRSMTGGKGLTGFDVFAHDKGGEKALNLLRSHPKNTTDARTALEAAIAQRRLAEPSRRWCVLS